MATLEFTILRSSRNLVVLLAGLAVVPLPVLKPEAATTPVVVEAPPIPRPLIAAYRECLRSRSPVEFAACVSALDSREAVR